jgi:hypothetical protein
VTVVNDRLYDELLRPVAEDYFQTAKTVAALMSVPATADCVRALVLQERMSTLQETGDRIAGVIEVEFPLWDDMRDLAGMGLW